MPDLLQRALQPFGRAVYFRGQAAAASTPAKSISIPTAKPRLLFLHPKTLVDSWPFPVDTLGEIIKAPSAVYPVLAGMISDLPIEIEMFDGYVCRESFRNYKERLRRADILAITVMSPLKALDTELTIRLAKRLNENVTVILGGNHATAHAARWIEKGADFVVVGEGEVAFRALMQALLANRRGVEDVPNLVYRHGTGSRATGIKPAKLEFEDAPLPRWDLLDLRPYALGLGAGGFTAAVEASRGCPHRCDFCSINTFWNYKQRFKTVERICEELEQLHRLGVREFIFTDDNFAQDHRHTRKLMEEMIRRDLGMRFGSFMRGDTVNRHPELIELAARAGLSFCLMGIETLDREWLATHSKGVRAEDVVAMYRKTYETLKRQGIFVIGLFITPAEADTSLVSGAGADGLVCDAHYVADLVAQKGSALYDKLLAQGSVGKDMFYHDWNLPSIVLQNGKVQTSRKSIFKLVDWNPTGLRQLFGGPSLARRFRWRHIGIFLERLACSSGADIRRYRVAKDRSIPLGARQEYLVQSSIGSLALARLLRRNWHKSPLGLRNGLWSAQPIEVTDTAASGMCTSDARAGVLPESRQWIERLFASRRG